jgi:rhodanese-related sulfurtransferase
MTSRRLAARSLVLAAVLACCPLAFGGQREAGEFPRVTREELKKLIDAGATDDIVIVDTQPREYFDEAHIPGAVNLPYTDRIRPPVNLPRTRTLVLYCPCEHEEESAEMAGKLRKLGYTKLKLLQGGLPAWREAAHPTVASRK